MSPPGPPAHNYGEDALIEQPAIELLNELGWKPANLFKETFGADGTEGRKNNREVVLTRRLLAKLKEFNPNLPDDAYNQAIEELTRDRSAMIPVNANQEFYRLLKDGVRVTVKDEAGGTRFEALKVVDWSRNTFCLKRARLFAFTRQSCLTKLQTKSLMMRLSLGS